MNKIRTILTGVSVLATVGGALAFKSSAFGPSKLYTCNAATQLCAANDPSHFYQFNVAGTTLTASALSTTSLVGKACTGNCNSTIVVSVEGF